MGYGADGLTNKVFMIKKANLKPAFMNVCKLNINNSLKSTMPPTCIMDNQGNVKDTYATDNKHSFLWAGWNYDYEAKTLKDALEAFGLYPKFDQDGNLVRMAYNEKIGDLKYLLYAIAPYVEKGGKMNWHDDVGNDIVTDFDKLKTYSVHELKQERDALINRAENAKHFISQNPSILTNHRKRAGNDFMALGSLLYRHAIRCFNKLADVNSHEDLATAPANAFAHLLTPSSSGTANKRWRVYADLYSECICREIPTDRKCGDFKPRHRNHFEYLAVRHPKVASNSLSAFYSARFTDNTSALAGGSPYLDYVAHYLDQTVKALKAQTFKPVTVTE